MDIAENGKQESARVAAASALLDRGWGRPTQPIAGDAAMPPVGLTVEDKNAELEERRKRAREIIDAAFAEVVPANDRPPDSLPEPVAPPPLPLGSVMSRRALPRLET